MLEESANSESLQMPDAQKLWEWGVSFVPDEYKQWVVVGGTALVTALVVLNYATTLLRFWREVRNFWKSKKPVVPLGPDEMPPPKISFWTKPVNVAKRPSKLSNSIPIVTIAAMKGGVGKTTLTANLAAFLDRRGSRVLLIDFDYQGSLSQMVTAAANLSVKASVVDSLIDGTATTESILTSARSLSPALPNTKLLSCYYQFSDTETNVMVNWVCADRMGGETEEIRFRLERLLHNRDFQSQFDFVLIDAPPRFSTGAMNAFCASTHMIIPTVLDTMSAEAATYFSQDIASMRQELFPELQLIGVIPSMTYQTAKYTRREDDIIDYLNDNLKKFWGGRSVVLEKANIPRKNAIGDVAGLDIGYLDAGTKTATAEVRKIFDRVGAEFLRRLEHEQS
ncbi:ParA family protein [Hyphomonas chukchiensis]|uniref:AAA domain-containing protein n=1 Tax=Hyphomonas chukchiensis TaxID=1280947 RepID=A0A062U8T6_9PROT|nr:ParA family protein [Hyphomonas chukchiensis]KCZ56751.1 hypothetical protein HY30_06435 [Hyphomonas chukchiensis]